jgi:hypothetical protein
LIASEARPGGNVTGIEPYVPGLPAKQVEFAREIVPSARRVGLLTNLQDPKAPPQRHELASAAKALEITVGSCRNSSATLAHFAMPIRRETGGPGRSHSASFDHLRRPETFRTAMATAFFCPTSTTSRLPRVIPV